MRIHRIAFGTENLKDLFRSGRVFSDTQHCGRKVEVAHYEDFGFYSGRQDQGTLFVRMYPKNNPSNRRAIQATREELVNRFKPIQGGCS